MSGRSQSPPPRRGEASIHPSRLAHIQRDNQRERSKGTSGHRDSDRQRRRSRSRSRERHSSRREEYRAKEDRNRDQGRGDARGSTGKSRHERPASPDDRPRKRRRSTSRDYDRKERRDRDRPDARRQERGSERDSRALQRRSRSRSRSKSRNSEEEREKPNFGNSGLLAAATNTVQRGDGTSTVLKYNEPPEARKPVENWRLYDFSDENDPVVLAVNKQSAYLFGRDAAVVDIPLDHPSCSKQHAAIQYRHVMEQDKYGDKRGVVKPFIIDLESTNGTHVNDESIPAARYYELKVQDVIRFGTSKREFVLLHEDAAA